LKYKNVSILFLFSSVSILICPIRVNPEAELNHRLTMNPGRYCGATLSQMESEKKKKQEIAKKGEKIQLELNPEGLEDVLYEYEGYLGERSLRKIQDMYYIYDHNYWT